MLKTNLNKIEEILKDKPYLLENNYCPNVGLFPNDPSNSVRQILKGSDVYRYDIYNYRDDDDEIINLGGGDPIQFKTYKYIKKDIFKYIKSNTLNKYPNTIGSDFVKKSLVEYLTTLGLKRYKEENIIITASTTHAYSLVLKTIMKPNDVIIIPVPTYGLFTYKPEKIGGEVVFYKLEEKDEWKINPKKLNELIQLTNEKLQTKYKNEKYIPRVVALYNQNPNNPLSVFLNEKDKQLIHDINEVCYKNNTMIIDDLVYKDSLYDKNSSALPMGICEEFQNNIISLFGLSKSYSLSALRTGFIVANEYIIQDIRDNLFLELDSISMINQISLASVFNSQKKRTRYREKFLKKINEKYMFNLEIVKYFIIGEKNVSRKTKRYIESKMTKENLNMCKNGIKNVNFYHDFLPESGFFALIDFTKLKGKKIDGSIIYSDRDLIISLFKKSKIKFLPGSSFGWQNDNEIIGRITFSQEPTILIKNLSLLSKIINEVQ